MGCRYIVALLAAAALAGLGGRVVARGAEPVAVAKISAADAQMTAARNNLKNLQSVGKLRIEDLVRVSVSSGQIEAEILEAARKAGNFKAEVEGSTGDWMLSYNRYAAGAGRVNENFSITRYDFEDAGGMWMAAVRVYQSTQTTLNANATVGSGADTGRISVYSSGSMARLTVSGRKLTKDGRSISIQAPNLLELRNQNPIEFRNYVAPVLARVLGKNPFGVAPADAYRVFDHIPADPKMIQRVEKLLPGLDSPLAAQRDRASAELAALGPGAVLAAIRIDRSYLTPEQAGRLDAYISRHGTRRFATPEEARKDIWFLIDAMEFEDPAVRSAALGLLSKAMGRALEFDVNGPAEARAKATDALRDLAVKFLTEKPATQPPATQPGAEVRFVPQPASQ